GPAATCRARRGRRRRAGRRSRCPRSPRRSWRCRRRSCEASWVGVRVLGPAPYDRLNVRSSMWTDPGRPLPGGPQGVPSPDMTTSTPDTGAPRRAEDGERVIETFDPRSGALLGVVPDQDEATVRAAIGTARAAAG